jgi:hypothetical protein
MNALLCCPPSYWWVICDMTRRSETSGVQPIRKYRLDYSSGRIYYSLDQISKTSHLTGRTDGRTDHWMKLWCLSHLTGRTDGRTTG